MAKKESIKSYYKSEVDGIYYIVKVKAVSKTLNPDGSRTTRYASFKGTKNSIDKVDADGNVIGSKQETKAQVEERLFNWLSQKMEGDGFVIVKP